MSDRYVFSDEAGNFDFSHKSGASRYFILGTVTASDCRIGDATILEKSKAQLHLRNERALYKMAWYLHFKFVAPEVATTRNLAPDS